MQQTVLYVTLKMGENTLVQHVEFAYINYICIITFCCAGILLNAMMLIYLIKKKKMLASVYSIYMIQIVATDILVCAVWLVMLVLLLNELPSYYDIQKIINPANDGGYFLSKVEESFKDVNKNFETYRIIFAVYNMHYYVNIFLLAVMSIERCIAVKKSLQCQRYQFKKNVICVVSAGMWVTAIACAVPSYINPDWITESEQTDILLGRVNENGGSVLSKELAETVFLCVQPLHHAKTNQLSIVHDYNGASVEECFWTMQTFVIKNQDIPGLFQSSTSDSAHQAQDDKTNNLVKRDLNDSDATGWDKGTTLPLGQYEAIFHHFARAVHILSQEQNNINDVCDPRLSQTAKIYQIITNLTVGFFIPFSVILISNLYIAYHIWMPAQKRLENRKKLIKPSSQRNKGHPTTIQYSHVKQNGHENASSPAFSGSSANNISRDNNEEEYIELRCINESEESKLPIDTPKSSKKFQLSLPTFGNEEDGSGDVFRERTPSFLRMLHNGITKKKFRDSTTSNESFPTDLTSLVISTSPGVNQSKQTFLYGDELESQAQTASSESSKRASMRSHSIIPEINICTEELENSLKEILPNKNNLDSLKLSAKERSNETVPNESTKIKPELDEIKQTATSKTNTNQSSETTPPTGVINWKPELTATDTKSKNTSPFSRLHSYKSVIETPNQSTHVHEGSSHTAFAGSKSHITIYKNAERQIQLSRIILLYVAVFAACWLPSKVVMTIYYTDGYIGRSGHFCHRILGITRMLSFISVLLNPIVYAATQKTVNRFLRKSLRRLCLGLCMCACVQKIASKFTRTSRYEDGADCSCIKIEEAKNGRKNKQRWSKIVERWGRKNLRFSYSATHRNTSKLSDGVVERNHNSQEQKETCS